MKKLEDYLWVEKYRPTTLDGIILDKSIKDKLKEYKDDEQIPHLLLVGSAGIGKTTTARILVNEVLDCDSMMINASDESGVDTIRSKVKSFATSASLQDKLKVVVFGEADGMSKTAQDSLKEIIEDCSETTRFIFTANNLSKLSEPIRSRCQRIDLKCSLKDFVNHCASIMKQEGIKVNKGVFLNICKNSFPDFRLCINELQQNIVNKELREIVVSEDSFVSELWKRIDKDEPEKVRNFCIEHGANFGSHCELMIDMARYSFDNHDVNRSRKLIMLLNDYMFKDTTVVDKEINFYCLLIELCK